MPEVDGLGVVRLIRRIKLPLIAFVTAYDEYAVRAFEMNAVDYLLKPVDAGAAAQHGESGDRAARAGRSCARGTANGFAPRPRSTPRSLPPTLLRRIPVRKRDDIYLVPVDQIVSIIADGELLHLTTRQNERLHDHLSTQGSRDSASIPRSSFESRAARCSTSA